MLEAGKEFYTAYLAVQTELDSLKKNRSGRFKYADLDYLMDNLRPILEKHKLAYIPSELYDIESRTTVLIAELIHTESGQGKTSSVPLRAFEFPEYDDQLAGKNITYQRRYMLMALLNITLEDDVADDNGHSMNERRNQYRSNTNNDNNSAKTIDREKARSMRVLLASFDNGITLTKNILAFNKVESIEQLREDQYVRVLTYIKENAVKQSTLE